MLFSFCILVTLKFAAGRQVCRPSRAKLGLKDWASIKYQIAETHWKEYTAYPLVVWLGQYQVSNRLTGHSEKRLLTSNSVGLDRISLVEGLFTRTAIFVKFRVN
jgi:hypothetical protein